MLFFTSRKWLTFSLILLSTSLWCHSSALGQPDKAGLGASAGSLSSAANVSWAYDWGNNGASSGHNGEYVPMFWNGAGNIESTAARLITENNSDYILGFNEPERSDQANISVATAVARWRRITSSFAGTGIKLVGPAVSDNANGRAWLADFMAEVDADPTLHVDEVAFHWYGTVNINNPQGGANSFLNRVAQYHNDYGRNVWITEFAGLDFGGNYTTQQMNDWNEAFLDIVIPVLESRDYVTRYAWWNHNNDSRLLENRAWNRLAPTPVGDTYVGTLSAGDTRDMNGGGLGLDFQFLRGGELLNNGANRGASFGRLYSLANHDGSLLDSSFGGSGNWSMHNWGSVTIEDNSRLIKVGLNTVTLRDLDLEIEEDGVLLLAGGTDNQGVLEISGSGTNARGTGLLQLNWPNSNLVLGRQGDAGTLELPYDFELRHQSTLTINSDVLLDSDTMVLTGSTTWEVNHDLEFDGAISGTSSFAGISKVGAESLTLGGANAYAGNTNVNEGSLLVNGTHTGGGLYNINNAMLGGSGAISSVVILNSGAVAPGTGSTTGALSATAAVFDDQSKLTIEIASDTDFDQLLLSSGISVQSGTTLELVLLGGFVPTVGDQFNIIDFSSFTGEFDTSSIPSLPQGNWDFSQLNTQGIVSVVGASALGDINQDNTVNFLDIAPFINILSTAVYFGPADCNEDGVVDFLDINPFIAILTGL